MKKCWQALMILLCLLALLSGCQQEPVQTQPPTTAPTTAPPETTVPVPTAPDALEAYGEAKALLEAEENVALEVVVTTRMEIKDQVFYTESIQNLTYFGIGGEAPVVSMEEKIAFAEPGTAMEDQYFSYREVWEADMLYTSFEDSCFLSAELPLQEMADRFVPVILADESLYATAESQLDGGDVLVNFSEPSAPEAWALPEGAELLEASAEAVINKDGKLEQMVYLYDYTWGPAEYSVSVCTKVLEEVPEEAPAVDGESYTQLQYADALKTYIRSTGMMLQSNSVEVSALESVVSQAAGVIRNQSTAMDYYYFGEEPMTKIETGIFFADSTGEEQRMEQEEVYSDGKYVVTVDDGVPTTYTDMDDATVDSYCAEVMLSYMADPSFWAEATAEDLGSAWLVTYTLSEDFGTLVQNSICTMFWEDAGYLNNLASAYRNNELAGYLAFEKHTGLPTAAGYYYEGVHTLDGYEYILSLQGDQSIKLPAYGAYHEITDQWLPEEAPETPATPLFYHVTGEDGQEMWLLGTIHVGDERTGFLPQEIYDAFAASDALALEFDDEAFEKAIEEDDDLQDEVSDCYYYSNGKTAEDYLDEETYEQALKYLKVSGEYNMNAPYMKVCIWSESIDNFIQRAGHLLTREQGVETRLTKLAHEQEKPILDVESGLFQVKMSTGWSDDLQVLLLEESLETDPYEYWQNLEELYELWCAGDEEAMRERLSSEADLSELTEEELAEYESVKHLLDEYNKAMSYDRNDGMLEVAIEYLESDQVVFYAVGLAHLVDNHNGLIDTLREAGYTVELVTYKN